VISNGSGAISGSVATVQISCPQPKFSVGGSVTGLVIGNGDQLELQDNAGDNLFVTGDVPFIFPTPFSYGTTYSVTGFLPPTSQPQGCTIFFATAVVLANVSNVLVDCQHNDWGWGVSCRNASSRPIRGGIATDVQLRQSHPATAFPRS